MSTGRNVEQWGVGLCRVASKWRGGHALRSEPPQLLPRLPRPSGEGQTEHSHKGSPWGFCFFLEDMKSWKIDSNGGDQWKVESLPGAHGTGFPDSKVKKYFVTSYE